MTQVQDTAALIHMSWSYPVVLIIFRILCAWNISSLFHVSGSYYLGHKISVSQQFQLMIWQRVSATKNEFTYCVKFWVQCVGHQCDRLLRLIVLITKNTFSPLWCPSSWWCPRWLPSSPVPVKGKQFVHTHTHKLRVWKLWLDMCCLV